MMPRNLKALGPILLAALAFGVPAASADDLHSEGSETEITGTVESPLELTTSSETVNCAAGTSSGKMSGSTVTTIAMAPIYSGCTTSAGFFAKFTINGCEYLFHIESEGSSSGNLVCPEEKEVTITIENFLGEDICTLHIHPETGHITVKGTNIGTRATREIITHYEFFGFTYTETKGTAKEPCKTSKTTHDLEGDLTTKDTGFHIFGGKLTHTGIEITQA